MKRLDHHDPMDNGHKQADIAVVLYPEASKAHFKRIVDRHHAANPSVSVGIGIRQRNRRSNQQIMLNTGNFLCLSQTFCIISSWGHEKQPINIIFSGHLRLSIQEALLDG